MEAIRDSLSVVIPATEGLPAKLTSAKYQGVLLIADISQAIATKDYFKTPNHELPDCRSMMVCPINGWESGTKAMVGIVTIASRRLNAFEACHTISLKAMADILGLVYPSLLARLMGDRRAGGTACLVDQPPKSTRKRP